MDRARTDTQGGAILLTTVAVLMIVALGVLAVFVLRQSERKLGTEPALSATMSALDNALADFVLQHQRLPCPARGTLAASASGAGVESINLGTGQCVPATQADGVVPWITLGLNEAAALDPWNARISYRVQPALASNLAPLMNMSWCDPDSTALTSTPSSTLACAPAPCSGTACMHPFRYQYAKGLQVQDGSGGWVNQAAPTWAGAPASAPPASNGAAYVLISHGANGAGAYSAGGMLVPGTPGSNEMANRNGQNMTGATIFIAAARNTTSGAVYFDDVLSHPPVADVLVKARLGPRPH